MNNPYMLLRQYALQNGKEMRLYYDENLRYHVTEMTNLEFLLLDKDATNDGRKDLVIRNGFYVVSEDEHRYTQSWYPTDVFNEYFKFFKFVPMF